MKASERGQALWFGVYDPGRGLFAVGYGAQAAIGSGRRDLPRAEPRELPGGYFQLLTTFRLLPDPLNTP